VLIFKEAKFFKTIVKYSLPGIDGNLYGQFPHIPL
jgi:hypothetical protein